MTTLIIPDVNDDIARRLRTQAAVNGRTVEAEARSILADALVAPLAAPARHLPVPSNLSDAIRTSWRRSAASTCRPSRTSRPPHRSGSSQ